MKEINGITLKQISAKRENEMSKEIILRCNGSLWGQSYCSSEEGKEQISEFSREGWGKGSAGKNRVGDG